MVQPVQLRILYSMRAGPRPPSSCQERKVFGEVMCNYPSRDMAIYEDARALAQPVAADVTLSPTVKSAPSTIPAAQR